VTALRFIERDHAVQHLRKRGFIRVRTVQNRESAFVKALGVTMLDFDVDGWPDLFVANDTQPNKLYRNQGDRTFQEVAVQAGLAFSEDGRARAGMGTDAADFDNSGVPSLVVTNFSGEMLGLYVPVRRGVYADRAPGSELGKASRLTLGFGCFFFDADLDGLEVPVKVLRVAIGPDGEDAELSDKDGALTQRYDLRPGSVYLFRPDQHVCARWRKPTAAQVKNAVKRALAIA
jgi:hypothetical protein